jgi:hypothetical protein
MDGVASLTLRIIKIFALYAIAVYPRVLVNSLVQIGLKALEDERIQDPSKT